MSVVRLTPAGAGAVAVLEVLGTDPLGRLSAAVGGRLPRDGELRLARLRAGEETLDEVLLVGRGEAVELHLHGGRAVLARVARELGGLGDAPRASLRERARASVATAPSEDGARILLDQAEGALERELERVLASEPGAGRARLEALLAAGRAARPLLAAPRVVLAGPTNAGKSTLFNVLLGAERALTSAIHGTTRDALVEPARLGRLGVELIDTAGERELADDGDPVEAAGQALAANLRGGADLVLWLTTDGAPAPRSSVPVLELQRTDGADTRPLAARGAGAGPLEVRPLVDPEGARRAIAEAAEGALPHGAWCEGTAVPFEHEQLVLLERALAASGAEREVLVARMLA